jgi:hypothetical protein
MTDQGDRMSDTTRREFLKGAGTYGFAAGVGLAGGAGLAGGKRLPRPVAGSAQEATHPFGYPEGGLEVEKTRELGYLGFRGLELAHSEPSTPSSANWRKRWAPPTRRFRFK